LISVAPADVSLGSFVVQASLLRWRPRKQPPALHRGELFRKDKAQSVRGSTARRLMFGWSHRRAFRFEQMLKSSSDYSLGAPSVFLPESMTPSADSMNSMESLSRF